MTRVVFNPLTYPGPLPSPCISICRMHPQSGLCEGCLRTTDEIAFWGDATEDEKRTIWVELINRRCTAEAEALSKLSSGSDIHFDATGGE